jgi:hypothetical protein
MTMMLSELEAKYLAKALEAMRPDWQYAGILHALGAARLKAHKWTVASAAITAASDEANRTPAVIPLDGRHWPVMEAPRTPPKPKRPELTEEEREAAHRQYLAAAALLAGREPRCHCGVLKSEPANWCAGHALPEVAS